MQFFVFLLVFLPFLNGIDIDDTTKLPNISMTLECNSEELRRQGLYTLHENIFTHCEELISLNLTNNIIHIIKDHVFQNLTNLNVIDLSYNHISTIPTDIFSDTKKLEQFYISRNHITSLQRYLFANLPYLKVVDFQFNRIASIEENCFVNVPSLTIISLKFNNLKTLQMNIIDDMSSLEKMYLYGNEWNCDIKLCEFMQTVVTFFWHEPFVPICYAPKSFWGSTWKKVINTAKPAISANIRNDPTAKNLILECYTCSENSISWQYERSKSLTNQAIQISGKYNTLSALTIKDFSSSDVGNYTCFVDDCPSCSSSWIYVYFDFVRNSNVLNSGVPAVITAKKSNTNIIGFIIGGTIVIAIVYFGFCRSRTQTTTRSKTTYRPTFSIGICDSDDD